MGWTKAWCGPGMREAIVAGTRGKGERHWMGGRDNQAQIRHGLQIKRWSSDFILSAKGLSEKI